MNHFSASASAILLAFAAAHASAAGPASTDAATVAVGTYALEPYHTRIQFAVSHMGFTNWYGDFTGASGSLSLDPKNVAASKLDITIPVGSVSTTNAKLDDELKSPAWFDAVQFPTIRFVATKVTRTGADKAAITGNLTFHGVTRPVILAASFNGVGVNPLDKKYTVGFDANTTIKRSDFGVKTYLPLIGDDTALRISVAFEKAE